MNRRWEWIILSVRSLTVFEENIVVTVLAKIVWSFFQNCTCPFFFLRALQLTCVRLWQILVKIMFQSLLGSLLNHPYLIHYVHGNVLMQHLSLICITSILTIIYPLKYCSIYGGSCCNYSPKSFGSFGRNLVKFKEKNKDVIHQSRSVRIGKNCAYCLEYRQRPWAGE